jgi:hypothetical protein
MLVWYLHVWWATEREARWNLLRSEVHSLRRPKYSSEIDKIRLLKRLLLYIPGCDL